LKRALAVLSFAACTFFGIEGGYQLHLSHDHQALTCLERTLAASAGNQIDGPPSFTAAPPPCREPDEIGQFWRRELVLKDMLGFLIYGMLCIQETEEIILADAGGV
jgi:hypothetical protein